MTLSIREQVEQLPRYSPAPINDGLMQTEYGKLVNLDAVLALLARAAEQPTPTKLLACSCGADEVSVWQVVEDRVTPVGPFKGWTAACSGAKCDREVFAPTQGAAIAAWNFDLLPLSASAPRWQESGYDYRGDVNHKLPNLVWHLRHPVESDKTGEEIADDLDAMCKRLRAYFVAATRSATGAPK